MPVFSTLNSISCSKFHKATCKDSIQGKLQLITEIDGARTGPYLTTNTDVIYGRDLSVGDEQYEYTAVSSDGTIMVATKLVAGLPHQSLEQRPQWKRRFLSVYKNINDTWVIQSTLELLNDQVVFANTITPEGRLNYSVTGITMSSNGSSIALCFVKKIGGSDTNQYSLTGQTNDARFNSNIGRGISVFSYDDTNGLVFKAAISDFPSNPDSSTQNSYGHWCKMSPDGTKLWVHKANKINYNNFNLEVYNKVGGIWGNSLITSDTMVNELDFITGSPNLCMDITSDGKYFVHNTSAFAGLYNPNQINVYKLNNAGTNYSFLSGKTETITNTDAEINSLKFSGNGLYLFVGMSDKTSATSATTTLYRYAFDPGISGGTIYSGTSVRKASSTFNDISMKVSYNGDTIAIGTNRTANNSLSRTVDILFLQKRTGAYALAYSIPYIGNPYSISLSNKSEILSVVCQTRHTEGLTPGDATRYWQTGDLFVYKDK